MFHQVYEAFILYYAKRLVVQSHELHYFLSDGVGLFSVDVEQYYATQPAEATPVHVTKWQSQGTGHYFYVTLILEVSHLLTWLWLNLTHCDFKESNKS